MAGWVVAVVVRPLWHPNPEPLSKPSPRQRQRHVIAPSGDWMVPVTLFPLFGGVSLDACPRTTCGTPWLHWFMMNRHGHSWSGCVPPGVRMPLSCSVVN